MNEFKAGQYIKQSFYKSFQPNPINRPWIMDGMEVLQLLGIADRELGRLDMYSEYIPNIELFIKNIQIKFKRTKLGSQRSL